MEKQVHFDGVTEAQRSLVTYWLDQRDSSGQVSRKRINPGHFKSQLASISIIEFRLGETGRFRIAGSRLRDLFGIDVRGRKVDDVHGGMGEAYALGLSAARERGEPVGGVMDTPNGKHAWLRLPLVDEAGKVSQVLCHDELLSAVSAKKFAEQVIPINQHPVAA